MELQKVANQSKDMEVFSLSLGIVEIALGFVTFFRRVYATSLDFGHILVRSVRMVKVIA